MPSNLHFDERIKVSVIVPCFNTAQFLDQCLTSIEADDFTSLEVIVLNDGSTDNSLEIMRRHEKKDSRIRVIDKPNQGYGATVNRGIEESRGAYIAIVEPDRRIKVEYLDENFVHRIKNFSGYTAEIIQHEIDHCNGIVI